jgi:hypothetical protein
MLSFQRHLADPLPAGRKHAPIRAAARPLVRPGQICFSPGQGGLRINTLDALPSIDALAEASPSPERRHATARAEGYPRPAHRVRSDAPKAHSAGGRAPGNAGKMLRKSAGPAGPNPEEPQDVRPARKVKGTKESLHPPRQGARRPHRA